MKKIALFLKDGFDLHYASVINEVIAWNNKFGQAPIEILKTGVNKSVFCDIGAEHQIDVEIKDLVWDNIEAVVYSNAFTFLNAKTNLKNEIKQATALEKAFLLLEALSSTENVGLVKKKMEEATELYLCA